MNKSRCSSNDEEEERLAEQRSRNTLYRLPVTRFPVTKNDDESVIDSRGGIRDVDKNKLVENHVANYRLHSVYLRCI